MKQRRSLSGEEQIKKEREEEQENGWRKR